MPNLEIEIEVEVFCDKCGEGLCLQSYFRKSRYREVDQLVVAPCKSCIDSAVQQSKEEMERNVVDV